LFLIFETSEMYQFLFRNVADRVPYTILELAGVTSSALQYMQTDRQTDRSSETDKQMQTDAVRQTDRQEQ